MTDPIERFMAKVEKSGTGCWLWTASTFTNGYGCFYFEGKNRGAHRWLYEREMGPVPSDMELDHLCRVRSCVNPKHLEVVDHAENTRRAWKASGVDAACRNGHPRDDVLINKQGFRVCRACRRERDRAAYKPLSPEQRARKTELQRMRRAAKESA